jgi:hypothetical protein
MSHNIPGRHRIPDKEKKWFAKVIQILLKETGLPQADFAELVGVSRPWVSRAKAGHFGPWPRPTFEEKINVLVEEGGLKKDRAQQLLAEFSLNLESVRPPQFMFLHRIKLAPEFSPVSGSQSVFISPEGPTDEDFIKRRIVIRPEVDDICKTINRGRRFVLIVGPQASGKSVTAVHAIYSLSKESYTGYCLHTKDITDAAKRGILEELERIDDRLTILLVEDAHIDPRAVNHLIECLQEMRLNCIVTTRPSYKYQLVWGQRNLLAQIENGKLGQAYKFDTSSRSYKRFLENLISKMFAHRNSEPSPEVVEKFVSESGGDLWALRFLLEASDGSEVNRPQVFAQFHERFLSLRRQQESAELALSVVATFWQYELPVPGQFLTGTLRLPQSALQYLTDQGDLVVDDIHDFYSLQHASIAKHLYETACYFPHLWGRIIPQDCQSAPHAFLAIRFLEYNPDNVYQLFRHIRYDPSLMSVCLRNEKVIDTVFSYIHNPDEPLLQAADLISDIALYSSQETRVLLNQRLRPDLIKEKLNKTEDLAALAYFIESLPWEAKASWASTVNMVNEAALTIGARSLEVKDQRLVYCPFTARFGSLPTILLELSKIVSSSKTVYESGQERALLRDAQLCCKSGEVPTICLKSTLHTPGPLAIAIVRHLDQSSLVAKLLRPHVSLFQIAKLLSVLAWTDRSVYERLVEMVSVKSLLNKLEETQSVRERNIFLWAVQQANPLYFDDAIWPSLSKDVQGDYRRTDWVDLLE